jgi:uncharacterized protein YegP (UPF0339 family)
MSDTKAQVYKDGAGEYRWRVVAANGEIIGVSSESYTRRADALRGYADFRNTTLPDFPDEVEG